MKKTFLAVVVMGLLALGMAGAANATSVAIVKGSWYTSDLYNNLTNAGLDVSEITSYDATSLQAYDAVVTYGNTYTNMTYLESYVNGGGTLVTTPWFWWNYSPPADLAIFTHGSQAQHYTTSPGITVLDAGDPLLDNVSLPLTDAFQMGRTTSLFTAGVTEVARWADGYGFLGYRDVGLGTVVGINMQVITSDTWYQIINEPWATQLFVNAVESGGTAPVPEPATLFLLATGLTGLAGTRVRKRKKI